MKLAIIVAASENNVIGNRQGLPWRLPADLAYFRKVTLGHPVVMGRKTYQSIGKPLPHRLNIVVSRQPQFQAEGCLVVTSLEEARLACGHAHKAFIIGGSELYRLALPSVDMIYLTRVHAVVDGDTFLPDLDLSAFTTVLEENLPSDTTFSCTFLVYSRA